jgi:hypothetical protein
VFVGGREDEERGDWVGLRIMSVCGFWMWWIETVGVPLRVRNILDREMEPD